MSLTSLAYRAVRPVLFRLSPEQAHRFALATLRRETPWRLLERPFTVADPRLHVELGGLVVPNPVGLAPGVDKNGLAAAALGRLGFGYVVVGSITREPRRGNRRPRLARDVANEAIVNSLGLPSLGVDAAVRALGRLESRPVPVIASVAGFSSEELVELAAAVEPVADAVEIGLVCPNSTESERMRELEMFDEVVRGVMARRRKPVFVKLPPHHDAFAYLSAQEMVKRAADAGLDGVSVSGSRTIPVKGFPNDRGSLAGRPVFPDALRIATDVAGWAAGRLAVRAAGGVFGAEEAVAMLAAGADAVEVYSAFVFRGPYVAADINRGLLAQLDRRGARSVATFRPSTDRREPVPTGPG